MCRFVCDLREGLKEDFVEKGIKYISYNLNKEFNKFKNESMILDYCNYNFNKLLCEINREDILNSLREKLTEIFNNFKDKKVKKGRELITILVSSNKISHSNLEGQIKIDISNTQEGFSSATGLVTLNLAVTNNNILFEKFKKELVKYNLSDEATDYMIDLFENNKTIYRDFDYISDTLLERIGDETINKLRNYYYYNDISFNDVVLIVSTLYKNIYPYICISFKNENGKKIFTIKLFEKVYKIEYFRAEYNVLKAV